MLAGTGLSSTAKTVTQTRRARESGADIALVVTPPYVRPTQMGLLAHYREVAEHGGLPIVLYNVPPRTGCDLLPATVAELAVHPGVIGIKEANSEAARWEALYSLARPGFALLSGDDPTFVRVMAGGADGVISVGSNVLPRTFARLSRLAGSGQASAAQALDARLQQVYRFLAIEPNPIPLKGLLGLLGIGTGLRLPLLPLSAGQMASAAELVKSIRELESQLQ